MVVVVVVVVVVVLVVVASSEGRLFDRKGFKKKKLKKS